jgi:hypothetical protein
MSIAQLLRCAAEPSGRFTSVRWTRSQYIRNVQSVRNLNRFSRRETRSLLRTKRKWRRRQRTANAGEGPLPSSHRPHFESANGKELNRIITVYIQPLQLYMNFLFKTEDVFPIRTDSGLRNLVIGRTKSSMEQQDYSKNK